MAEVVKARYRVGGMDCAACASKIENAVGRIPGVTEVGASYTAGTMNVVHENVPFVAIQKAVKSLGYTVMQPDAPVRSPDGSRVAKLGQVEPDEGPWWKTKKALLTLSCAAALVVAYLVGLLVPAVGQWAFLAALLVGLVPIGRRAFAGAVTGTPFSIETLMTIAAVGAVIIGATEEAATVVLLFLVGELLEGVAAGRARASIRGLTQLMPKTAFLEEDRQTREVAADSLRVGSMIMVRPGDRIPADGEILEGSSSIDEGPVTGESVPKRKSVGDLVFAGTINTDAVLRIRVTAAAADNTIARVVKLVEEAQESKSADRAVH